LAHQATRCSVEETHMTFVYKEQNSKVLIDLFETPSLDDTRVGMSQTLSDWSGKVDAPPTTNHFEHRTCGQS